MKLRIHRTFSWERVGVAPSGEPNMTLVAHDELQQLAGLAGSTWIPVAIVEEPKPDRPADESAQVCSDPIKQCLLPTYSAAVQPEPDDLNWLPYTADMSVCDMPVWVKWQGRSPVIQSGVILTTRDPLRLRLVLPPNVPERPDLPSHYMRRIPL